LFCEMIMSCYCQCLWFTCTGLYPVDTYKATWASF